jgi:amino acid permease
MYQVAEALCQLSICAFYLRIMTDRKTRMVVWVLIGLVTCFGIGNTFAMVFNCTPISYLWTSWEGTTSGTCIDIRLFGFIRGGIEIALDLVILALPLPMLYRLQMSTRKKLQIMSMFCVGFVITVVSCLRKYHPHFPYPETYIDVLSDAVGIHGLIQFGQTQNPTCKPALSTFCSR